MIAANEVVGTGGSCTFEYPIIGRIGLDGVHTLLRLDMIREP